MPAKQCLLNKIAPQLNRMDRHSEVLRQWGWT